MKKVVITILTLIISTASIFGQNRKDSLIVFVGEKIELKYLPEEQKEIKVERIINGKDTIYGISRSMDSKYIAKYKVLQLTNGSYKQDTIEFFVFDHYGEPTFSKYKTVLLFVSYNNGKLYHEKYQYFDLYLMKDNKWTSPYSSREYNHPFKDEITIVPEKIQFKEEISFSINNLLPEEIQNWFPKPYYKIKKDKAIAIYGNYVEDLFKLKQQTILKARGIY